MLHCKADMIVPYYTHRNKADVHIQHKKYTQQASFTFCVCL